MSEPVLETAFADRSAAAEGLADYLSRQLQQAIDGQEEPLLILSGGRSPIETFNILSAVSLPWERVSVVLSDERWVPEYHEDSNAGMLRREFLIDKASACRFTSLYCDTRSPIDGTAEISRAVDALPATATVTLLGMGVDGHVASLFPNAPDLTNILASTGPVESVFPVGLNAPRMSLTPRRLLATRSLVLLLFGQEKLDVFRQAQQPGAVEDLPVRLFLQQRNVPLRLFWAP